MSTCSCANFRKNRSSQRGIAMLIVVTVLVSMVIVAFPFAMSMRQGVQRTSAVVARTRADFEATVLADLAKTWLKRTLPGNEARRGAGGSLVDGDPNVDSLSEFTPDHRFRKHISAQIATLWSKYKKMDGDGKRSQDMAALEARGLSPMNDDRGSIWTLLVEDAQGRVNANGASPFLLGNLFGSALLSEDLDPGAGDIPLENLTAGTYGSFQGFDPNGGYVRIGGEVIRYESFDGSTLRNCERGALRNTPLRDNGESLTHKQGTPVIDYAAYKIGTHIIARKPGELTYFRTLEELRDIATWGEGGILTADRLERLLPYLTVWSRRETGAWLADQLIVNALPSTTETGAPDMLEVRDNKNPTGNTYYVNPGTLVRVRDAINTSYATVASMGDVSGRFRQRQYMLSNSVTAVDETLEFDGGKATVSAYAPNPININTASRDVLYAVMANIHLWRGKGPKQVVNPELAWNLAGMIVDQRKGEVVIEDDLRRKGPFRHAEDFGRWLRRLVDQGTLTRAHHAALYMNAINPHSSELRFGTTSWCYRTLDVYHIETRVAINNNRGEQIAESGLREVVEIGADGPTTWSIDTQTEFEERLAMGSGAKFTTTFPYGVIYRNKATQNVEPGLRGPKQYINDVYADNSPELGDVRLQPARMVLPGANFVDHFDDSYYTHGWYTPFSKKYVKPVAGTMMRKRSDYVGPFQMSFWWRPYSRGNWTAFDCGVDQFTNRFALFVREGERGQELVFRCSAATLERQGAEVYVPLDRLGYEPGNWYHIEVACRGEDPSTMKLLVDGVDVGIRRGMSWLSGDLEESGDEMQLDGTEQFPSRGAVRIGDEIIEYDELAQGALRGLVRGARGTTARSFVRGTPVQLLGYAMPITVDMMLGGATLETAIGKYTAMRVISHVDEQPFLVEGSDTPIVLGGYNPDSTSFDVTAVPCWGQTDDVAQRAFQEEGLALWGCWQPANGADSDSGSGGPAPDNHFDGPGGGVDPGRPIPVPPGTDGGTDDGTDDGGPPSGGANGDMKFGGWEVVHYTRTGNSFKLTRYQQTAWQGAAEPYFHITRIVTGQIEFPSFIVPISIHAEGRSGEQDYLNPALPEHREILQRYYPGEEHTAYALLGTETPEDAFEVIGYNSIDTQLPSSGLYFVHDYNVGGLTNHFFNQPFDLPGGTQPDDDPVEPPTDDAGDDGTDDGATPPDDDGGDTDGFDGPGGGVPPGMRDPADPEDGGSDDGTVDDGGIEDPSGSDDGVDEPGAGGSGEDGGVDTDPELDEPLAGDDDPVDEGGTGEGETDIPDTDTDEEGGARDTGDVPSPEEPTEDNSGEGDSEDPETQGESDEKTPNQPATFDEDSQGRENYPDETGQPWDERFPVGPERARQLGNFRGVLNTFDRDNDGAGGSDRNGKFLPCFRVYEGVNGAPVARAGRNDRITITDGVPEATQRVEAGIRWGHQASGWCALEDFVDQRFKAPETGARTRRIDTRGMPRILKFPSSELPDEMSTEIEFGRSIVSNSDLVTAFLDELHIWRQGHDQQMIVSDEDGVLATSDEIELAFSSFDGTTGDMDGFDSTCGVFIIGGEMIIYRGVRNDGTRTTLERCLRGQFGTRIGTHPFGSHGRILPDMPVSFLSGGMPKEAAHVPLARQRGWPTEGLVRIVGEEGNAELVHFTRRADGALLMPKSLDADQETQDLGLFRGRFGTDPISHDSGAAVIFQPYRFWDRFTPRSRDNDQGFPGVYDHPETSYLELRRKIHGAYWRGFRWDENLLGSLRSENTGRDGAVGEGAGLLDIIVLMRFNPNVPWDSDRIVDMRSLGQSGRGSLGKNARDHLFVFDDPGDSLIETKMRGNALGVEADAAEFRIYFKYKPNCWVSNDVFPEGTSAYDDSRELPNEWKMTPWLKSLDLTYFSRTRTRYRSPIK